jgi:hypothetical protein
MCYSHDQKACCVDAAEGGFGLDEIRQQNANAGPFMTRTALTVALILIVGLNPAKAFAQGTWTATFPDPIPRWWSAIGSTGDSVAVAGGFSPSLGNLTEVERFPCGTDTGWCGKPSMLSAQTAPAYAGDFFVAGGNNGSGPVATFSMSQIPFLWSTETPMPTARQAPAGAGDGSLFYVMGGNTGSAVTGVVESYSTSSNSWTSAASMLTPRSDFGAATINGIIYAAGGVDGSSAALDTLEAYDPNTNTWTAKASMPTARADLAVVALNGMLYAIGGRSADGSPLDVVEAYQPASDTWTTEAPMPTARWGLVASVISYDGPAPVPAIYAIGGAVDVAGTTATGANEYFVPQCGTLNVTPTSVTFKAKGTQTVTVTNTGSVNVGMMSTTLDTGLGFVLGDGCSGNSLVPSASCLITVRSDKPHKRKVRQALTITDSACNSPQTVSVTRR